MNRYGYVIACIGSGRGELKWDTEEPRFITIASLGMHLRTDGPGASGICLADRCKSFARTISGGLRHWGSMNPEEGQRLGTKHCVGCLINKCVWMPCQRFVHLSNFYICSKWNRPVVVAIEDLVYMASDDEDTEIRWGFSVRVWKFGHLGESFWRRIVSPFWIRAVVEDVGRYSIEQGCLAYKLHASSVDEISCVAQNIVSDVIEPIALKELMPGGDGRTDAIHAQVSGSIRFGTERVQVSYKAGHSLVVAVFNNVAASGQLGVPFKWSSLLVVQFLHGHSIVRGSSAICHRGILKGDGSSQCDG